MTEAFPERFLSSSGSALLPPADIPIADWIEKHRRLPQGSAYEGPKRVSLTPSLRVLYEWFRDPFIREIVVIKSAQVGYTDAIVDLILWIAVNDPAPTVLFFADQSTAKKMMTARIRPAMKELGLIRKSADNRTQQATSYEVSLSNGFHLVVSWASSIAATASMAYKYIFCDEVDKPGYLSTGSEGGALGRIRERAETYPDSKMILGSTPTLDCGLISRELERCDAIFDYRVPCLACGDLQIMRWSPPKDTTGIGGVTWDGGRKATAAQIETSARYLCGSCGAKWTTQEKNLALSKGIAIPAGKAPPKMRRVGLRLNRILSLFPGGRLENLVSDWIGKQGDQAELQNFINSSLGEAWSVRIVTSSEEDMGKAKTTYAPGVVPDGALGIVVAVDMQQTGFWYTVRSWHPEMVSHLVEYGSLADWEDLEDLLFARTWGSKGLRFWRCLIDSGGTRADAALISRTEELYDWWSRNHRRDGDHKIFICKGSSRAMPSRLKIGSPLQKMPSGKPLRGALQLVELNTNQLKDTFFWRLEKAKTAESNAAYLHSGTDSKYFNQILAETKGQDGTYTRTGSRDNHYLDCEMMQQAAVCDELRGGMADIKRLRFAAPSASQQSGSTGQPSAQQSAGPSGPNPYTR